MNTRDLPLWKILVVTHLAALVFGVWLAWFAIGHQPSEQYVSKPAMFKRATVHIKANN